MQARMALLKCVLLLEMGPYDTPVLLFKPVRLLKMSCWQHWAAPAFALSVVMGPDMS